MLAILHALGMFIVDLFKSRRRLEAENLFLRHQLSIALRHAPPRLRLRGSDRALLVWMTRLWPSLLGAARVVQPDTILRWHRAGFRAFWRWKSRNRAGRPKIDRGLRDLIQRISMENPLWGAPRIHGEPDVVPVLTLLRQRLAALALLLEEEKRFDGRFEIGPEVFRHIAPRECRLDRAPVGFGQPGGVKHHGRIGWCFVQHRLQPR